MEKRLVRTMRTAEPRTIASAAAIIAAALLAAVPCPLYADAGADYAFSRAVAMPERAKDGKPFLAEVELDAEVLSRAAESLADVRVADGRGKLVPYLVERAVGMKLKDFKSYPLRETWRGVVGDKENPQPSAIFQIDPGTTEGVGQVNRLTLNIDAGKPYSIQILVEGRRDDGDWTRIKEDSAYEFEGTIKAFIDLGAAVDFNHFRLTAVSGTEGVSPRALMAEYDAEKEESRPFIREAALRLASRTERGKDTVLEYDAPPGLSVAAVFIEAPGRYRRSVDVESKGPNGPLMQRGIIVRAGDDLLIDRVDLDGEPRFGAKVTVVIHNGDDDPLEVRGARLRYRAAKLVFEADPSKTYAILFGRPDSEAPSYDLAELREFLADVERVPLALGPVTERPAGKAAGAPKAAKAIFNGAIVLVAAVLALLALLALRRRPPKPGN